MSEYLALGAVPGLSIDPLPIGPHRIASAPQLLSSRLIGASGDSEFQESTLLSAEAKGLRILADEFAKREGQGEERHFRCKLESGRIDGDLKWFHLSL